RVRHSECLRTSPATASVERAPRQEFLADARALRRRRQFESGRIDRAEGSDSIAWNVDLQRLTRQPGLDARLSHVLCRWTSSEAAVERALFRRPGESCPTSVHAAGLHGPGHPEHEQPLRPDPTPAGLRYHRELCWNEEPGDLHLTLHAGALCLSA